MTKPNNAIANWSRLYEIVLFVLSFSTEFAVENILYDIVPGQVRMTKNITWPRAVSYTHLTLPTKRIV